jgi:hypothetical protein
MKVYVLSEDSPDGIALANAINSSSNTAIIGNPEDEEYLDLIDKAVDGLDDGYDISILITSKPIEANIKANRTSKLRAVVCRSQADAVGAKKARANLVILDANGFDESSVAGIMRGLASSSGPTDEEDEPSKQGKSISEPFKSAIGVVKSGILGGMKGQKRQKNKEESKDEKEEDDIKKPKNGGIIENIKYTFGIE